MLDSTIWSIVVICFIGINIMLLINFVYLFIKEWKKYDNEKKQCNWENDYKTSQWV